MVHHAPSASKSRYWTTCLSEGGIVTFVLQDLSVLLAGAARSSKFELPWQPPPEVGKVVQQQQHPGSPKPEHCIRKLRTTRHWCWGWQGWWEWGEWQKKRLMKVLAIYVQIMCFCTMSWSEWHRCISLHLAWQTWPQPPRLKKDNFTSDKIDKAPMT